MDAHLHQSLHARNPHNNNDDNGQIRAHKTQPIVKETKRSFIITMSDFGTCANAAVVAFQQGNHRLSANKYIEAYHLAPQNDKTLWQIFHGYTSILKEEYFPATDNDLKSLQRIADDKSQGKLYRVEASFTCGLLLWIRNQREEAANYYRKAVRIAQRTSEKERKKTLMATLVSPDGNQITGLGMKSIGEIMDPIVEDAQGNLNKMEHTTIGFDPKLFPPSAQQQKLRSDGTPMPSAARNTSIPLGPLPTSITQEQIGRLLSVGGNQCDGCQKTLEELGRKQLQRCTRCGKTWYCGRECQTEAWKKGHKDFCRKPGEIKKGDYVRIQGLQSKPELNGTLVELVDEDPNNPGKRWLTRIPGGDTSVSIATGKLEQLRPLK